MTASHDAEHSSSRHVGRGNESIALAAAIVWCGLVLASYWYSHPGVLFWQDSASGTSVPPSGPNASGRLLRHFGALASSLAIALACYGYGRLASRLLPRVDLGLATEEALKFALGCGIGSLLVLGAGHLHLLHPALGFALLAGGLLCLLATLGRETGSRLSQVWSESRRLLGDRVTLPLVALLVVAATLALFVALAPPTARDALIYHLAIPKLYISSNAIVEVPQNVHSYLPFGTEMLFTWALLVGPDTGSQVLHLLFGVVVTIVVYSQTLRWTSSRRWGVLAAAVFATTPSVVWTAGLAHNEMPLCLVVTLSFISLGSWYGSGKRGDLLWFGAMFGLALSLKHTVLVLGPVFALVVLLGVRRTSDSERLRTGLTAVLAACLALVFVGPWYLQNTVRTGNPVFPYLWNLFPTHSPVWDAERARVLELYLRTTYGRTESVLEAVAVPWRVSISAREDMPALFDGVLGPAILLLVPVVVWVVARRRKSISAGWHVVGLCVALGIVAWASQSQQIRFLLPFVPCAAVLTVGALAVLSSRRAVGWVFSSALILVLLTNVGIAAASLVSSDPFRVVLGLEDQNEYLARRLRYYPFYLAINQSAPRDARFLLIDMRNDTYYLDRASFSDSVLEDYTISRLANSASGGGEIAAYLRTEGITHILVREDILLNPDVTPLDERGMSAWQAFLRDHTRRVATDGSIALYAVRDDWTGSEE